MQFPQLAQWVWHSGNFVFPLLASPRCGHGEGFALRSYLDFSSGYQKAHLVCALPGSDSGCCRAESNSFGLMVLEAASLFLV